MASYQGVGQAITAGDLVRRLDEVQYELSEGPCVDSLREASSVIGQALGILMERYDMNEDRAFAFLVRASSHGNIKLRDIAQEMVDQKNRN